LNHKILRRSRAAGAGWGRGDRISGAATSQFSELPGRNLQNSDAKLTTACP